MKNIIVASTFILLSASSLAHKDNAVPNEDKQLAKIGMNYESSSIGSIKREVTLGDPDFLSKFNESVNEMNIQKIKVFGNSAWGMDEMKNFLIDKPVDFSKLQFIEVSEKNQKMVFEGTLK